MNKIRVAILLVAFLLTSHAALAQTGPPIVQWQSILLTINNIQQEINNLQQEINVLQKAQGTVWTPTCVGLTGATPLLLPTNITYPIKECRTQVLSANTTLTNFPAASAPVAGWTGHLIFTQPSGSHSYTFAFSAGVGVNIVYPTSGGCSSLPSMPTGTGHSLLLDVIYNPLPSTPELDVLACPTTGS